MIEKEERQKLFFVEKIQAIISVSIGGFFGSVFRATTFFFFTDFIALMIVNIVGSYLIGFFLFLPFIQNKKAPTYFRKTNQIELNKPLLIGTGFFGAYTTFSFFILYPFLNIFEEMNLEFLLTFTIFVAIHTIIGVACVFAGKITADKVSEFGKMKKQKGEM